MADVKQFKLPDVGEGLTEADIVTWRVKPGDRVSVNQVIVEIETAKSLVELPSPFDGVVTDLLVPEGQTIDVGTPIISVDVAADAGAGGPGSRGAAAAAGKTPAGTLPTTQAEGAVLAAVNEPSAGSQAAEDLVPSPPEEGASEPGIEGSPAPKIERQAVLVGYGVKLGTTTRRARKRGNARGGSGGGRLPEEPVAPPAPATGGNGSAAGTGAPGRPMAKPPVRKLAKDLGVDLAALTGSGPEGTITREDVQAAAAGPSAAPAAPAQPALAVVPGGEERIPIRGVRKHTAAAVTSSAFTAPHVTEFLQIDVTETMSAVERLKALPDFAEVRVSPLLLVARALLTAVARNPMINARWDEASQEIVVPNYVNLGIAASTTRGLIVPNIKDAHALGLPALARALNELTQTARAGKTTPAGL